MPPVRIKKEIVLLDSSTQDTLCLAPTMRCLLEIEKFFDNKLDFDYCNNLQDSLLNRYHFQGKEDLDKLQEVMKGISDRNVVVVNKFLEDEGFDIRIQGGYSDTDLYVAGTFKYGLKWKEPQTKSLLKKEGDNYKSVHVFHIGEYFQTDDHDYPFARIETQNNEYVYMTIMDKNILQDWDKALEWIKTQKENFKKAYASRVCFPQIKYDKCFSLEWAKGLRVYPHNGDLMSYYEVMEALHQIRFNMDEIGAKIEAATAIGMSGYSGLPADPFYEIDRPFLLWIEKEGLNLPIFAGYFDEKSWVIEDNPDEIKKCYWNYNYDENRDYRIFREKKCYKTSGYSG